MELNDEIEPAAVLMANALRFASEENVPIPESSAILLGDAMELVSPASRALIKMSGALTPSVDQLLPLVRKMEAARYAEDVGYDVRNLVIAARRNSGEELRQFPAAAKGVAQHAECARRVAEALRRLCRRQFLHKEGAQGLILALARRRRLLEEAATVC